MMQIHVLNALGGFLGALLMHILLPLRDLRENRRPLTAGPLRYTARLILVGCFFLPNIIVRLQGPQAWLDSSFNTMFMAVANGVVTMLMYGCIFTLPVKNRVFWPALGITSGQFVYHLALGPGRDVLLPYMFAAAGIAITLSGVPLFIFLAGIPENDNKQRALEANPSPRTSHSSVPLCLFPLLAVLAVFWTNSFTDRLFMPTLNIYFPPGFHMTTVTLLLGTLLLGFIAGLWWRRFLRVFIFSVSFLFLLTPSLLLFSRSHPLFLILYTLNVLTLHMITIAFPFLVVDLYWKDTGKGFWGWLMPFSVNLIYSNALVAAGLFRTISLDNAYAVALLSLAAAAFFFLCYKAVLAQTNATAAATAASQTVPHISDIFREHNLSERETEVAFLLVREGLSNEEMGERLFISPLTVKSHVSQIYQKFGVSRRAAFLAKLNNQ